MKSIVYVSEPEVIDLGVARRCVEGVDIEFVPGATNFKGSMKQPYDVLLIRSATKVDRTIKDFFPEIKSIIRVGVGLDNVDLEYCRDAGISVFNAPGANADAVVEYVVAMILYVLRRLEKLNTERIRNWDRFAFRGSSIREHTVGIVGFGHIGRLLYEKLNAFSAPEFLVFDPYISPKNILADNIQLTSLEDLLKRASIISLHLPLTSDTYHLFDEHKLKLIEEGSVLINASRGGVVDEVALAARVSAGGLTYVADTVENEPHVNGSLLENENIILTPHIGSLTSFSEKEMVRVALNNYLNGMVAKVFG